MRTTMVFRRVAIAAILITATMQGGIGTANTATSYDLANTTRWERINDGYWSPNHQTPPVNGTQGSVTTEALANRDTGVLGATATAMSTASPPLPSPLNQLNPLFDVCAAAPDVSLKQLFDTGFGGFFCIQKGVKHGLAKAAVKKTFNLPITLDSNGNPISETHTVTVTVDTAYVVAEGSGPRGLTLCEQSQIPSSVRDMCRQTLHSSLALVPASTGSSFVMLSAWTFFENGSSRPPTGETCEQDPQCEIRSTPSGHPEDFPPSELAKWLYPGVTQFQLQVRGNGALTVWVELQASAYARGIADASASCSLDVTSIEAIPNG